MGNPKLKLGWWTGVPLWLRKPPYPHNYGHPQLARRFWKESLRLAPFPAPVFSIGSAALSFRVGRAVVRGPSAGRSLRLEPFWCSTGVGVHVPMFHISRNSLGYFISNRYLVWWCETNPWKGKTTNPCSKASVIPLYWPRGIPHGLW